MTAPRAGLRFGRFELQPHERRLLVDGEPVLLGGRALDVLTLLAERAGSLVTKNELLDRVWPGLVVEEHNIVTQVSGLRKVLGGDLIATIPGRGYRFTARVERAADAEPPPAPDAEPAAALALRTNLPATLPPLIGRDAELRELQAASAAHCIVTVLGAGGTGKTLLTQHLLRQAHSSFEHGVCIGADAGLLYRCLGARAVIYAKAGDALAADAALNEAQTLERPDWPLRLRICHTDDLRRVAKYLGRMEQSLTLSRQYLQMRQDAGAGTVPALSGLADTELAAGEADAAVRTGLALVAQLEGTREEQELAHARLNLCAAHLSLDQLQPARRTAVLGWKMAERFGMQAWWADYLALLAALDGRPQAAALLLGFADAAYQRTQDHREPNEAAAAARVRQLLVSTLRGGDTTTLLSAGALLPEAAVAALALEPGSR